VIEYAFAIVMFYDSDPLQGHERSFPQLPRQENPTSSKHYGRDNEHGHDCTSDEQQRLSIHRNLPQLEPQLPSIDAQTDRNILPLENPRNLPHSFNSAFGLARESTPAQTQDH
jgi:hypothetical protein